MFSVWEKHKFESRLVFLWMLIILLAWFNGAGASVCNVDAVEISPNNMIKFYDAVYISVQIFIFKEKVRIFAHITNSTMFAEP